MAAVLLRCSMGSNLRHVVRSSTNFQLDGFEFRFPATETPGKKGKNSVFFNYLCYFILFYFFSNRHATCGLILIIAPNFFSRPMIFLGRLFVILPGKQDPGKRLKFFIHPRSGSVWEALPEWLLTWR
jgi:hypothetical protein